MDWSHMNKLGEDVRLWFNNIMPKNKHEAAIIAIHVFALEMGFSLDEEENLRTILNKNSEYSVLNYRNNQISMKSKFILKYVHMQNFAMIYAFVGNTLANSSSIDVDNVIRVTADSKRYDVIYPEFSKLVKDEFLLKMIAESQYQENEPQTYGITLLPVHCLELIMFNLDLKDLGVCSRVNKSFKEAFDSQSLWRKMYERDFKILNKEIKNWKQSYKEKKLEEVRRKHPKTKITPFRIYFNL